MAEIKGLARKYQDLCDKYDFAFFDRGKPENILSEAIAVFNMTEDELRIYDAMQRTRSEWKKRPTNPHGAVIERRMEAYHDVIVYEDGYEERFYIGD